MPVAQHLGGWSVNTNLDYRDRQSLSQKQEQEKKEEWAWGEDEKRKRGCLVSGEVYTEKIWGNHSKQWGQPKPSPWTGVLAREKTHEGRGREWWEVGPEMEHEQLWRDNLKLYAALPGAGHKWCLGHTRKDLHQVLWGPNGPSCLLWPWLYKGLAAIDHNYHLHTHKGLQQRKGNRIVPC